MEDTDFLENPPKCKKTGKKRNPLESLAARVAGILEEADFKGAVRLACSGPTKRRITDQRIMDHDSKFFYLLFTKKF